MRLHIRRRPQLAQRLPAKQRSSRARADRKATYNSTRAGRGMRGVVWLLSLLAVPDLSVLTVSQSCDLLSDLLCPYRYFSENVLTGSLKGEKHLIEFLRHI